MLEGLSLVALLCNLITYLLFLSSDRDSKTTTIVSALVLIATVAIVLISSLICTS